MAGTDTWRAASWGSAVPPSSGMAVIRGLSCSREISFGGIWPKTRFTRYEDWRLNSFPSWRRRWRWRGSTRASEKLRPKASLAARRVSHGHLTVTENRLKSLGDRSACQRPRSSALSGLPVLHRSCSSRWRPASSQSRRRCAESIHCWAAPTWTQTLSASIKPSAGCERC